MPGRPDGLRLMELFHVVSSESLFGRTLRLLPLQASPPDHAVHCALWSRQQPRGALVLQVAVPPPTQSFPSWLSTV